MANAFFKKFKEACLNGTAPNLTTAGVLKIQLVDSADYTVNLSTHDFLDDVASAGRVGPATTLTNVTVTNGVLDFDDPTIAGVTGDSFENAVIYYEPTSSPTDATRRLVYFIDTTTGGALSGTPNGSGWQFQINASGLAEL
jgi:hypothetical protein